jgi:hypothetical protein
MDVGAGAIADNNSWKQAVVVTKAVAALEGLASGKQYWFKVSAIKCCRARCLERC